MQTLWQFIDTWFKVPELSFETESHIYLAGLRITVKPKMNLNVWFSYLCTTMPILCGTGEVEGGVIRGFMHIRQALCKNNIDPPSSNWSFI